MTESAKTDLICTSSYTYSVKHNFPCELANSTEYASFIVLCLVFVVSDLYTSSLPTG